MKDKFLISVVTPVFNEEENIVSFYQAVIAEFSKISNDYDYEFIFTDNCSSDRTFAILTDLASENPRVKVARFSRNFGYQCSIYTGYCLAKGDIAIQMDADLQDPPAIIQDFLKKWKEGYEVVYGVRIARKEGRLITHMRRIFYRLIDFLSEDCLPRDAGDFRLVDRKILDELKKIYDASPYLRGTISSLGFRQTGIPYERLERKRGKSNFSFGALVSLALDGILNHSVVPLRVATFTGIFISLALIFYFGALSILSFFFQFPWPKGFATVSALILISISLNALFLGIIGEYLARIYRQCKRFPITVIDRTHNLHLSPPRETESAYSSTFKNS